MEVRGGISDVAPVATSPHLSVGNALTLKLTFAWNSVNVHDKILKIIAGRLLMNIKLCEPRLRVLAKVQYQYLRHLKYHIQLPRNHLDQTRVETEST